MSGRRLVIILALLGLALANARAEVRLSSLFGDHLVLQRGRPVPIFGTASPGESVVVTFHGQSPATTADARGNWQVLLTALSADTNAESLTIAGSNTIILKDVLVGDVWLCSGQSNMDMGLADCNRPDDIGQADFPGIRSFRTPSASAGSPLKTLRGDSKWVVCSPRGAGGFSATAFYFARKIYQENHAAIPIGLIVSAVGGTAIDLWLAPEGLTDIPELKPLLSQPVLPDGPFRLANGMIYPLAPYGIKGAIWYQGENAEKTVQSPASYFLKMKALTQGWKRLWGMDDFPFYYVMIANYGERLPTVIPVLHSGGWDADTRLQQVAAMALPHAGCASAIDLGVSEVSWPGYHPKNKLDVGERLALWALKNDYGRPETVASGPVLRDVTLAGGTVTCSFDGIGSGLMVGAKSWYQPTREAPAGALQRFVIAGADGQWYPATAVIKDNQVLMSSAAVPDPRQVAYACWQNPEGCNLYNREGLPAAPFLVTDVTQHYHLTAAAGPGGGISPAGVRSLLPGMTALYTIAPAAGFYIQDVKVDGVSVGSVKSYTFDPVRSDHAIAATFSQVVPAYTIAARAGGGGTLTPSGSVTVGQGGSRVFTIAPDGENQAAVTVDGIPLGQRLSYAFSDVRAGHAISADFSGLVKATAGYGGTITPDGALPVKYGSNQTFAIVPIPGYFISGVTVDGTRVGPAGGYTFTNVTAAHAIAATFKSLATNGTGSVPQPDQLIFACRGESLPAQGLAAYWPAYLPAATKLAAIGAPSVDLVDGRKYARFRSEAGDGFLVGTRTAPIACQGASIVVVAKPVRNGSGAGWTSIADLFYDRLVLGIRNDSGLVCVRRNGPVDTSNRAIPDGQITILSLVVQPDGTYQVYANGEEIMANHTPAGMTALVPGVAGPYANSMTVGRNAPDAWTTFNGDIGDVYVYQVALSPAERRQLESFIANSLAPEKPSP